MTREQIDSVRKSFAKIEPIAPQAAALFYAKLFDLDPQLRQIFRGDLKEQGRKLMQVIKLAVENLERLDDFVSEFQPLGDRHVLYGLGEKDYQTAGAALLWTFAKALPNDFDAPTKEAWNMVYSRLAEAMRKKPSSDEAAAV